MRSLAIVPALAALTAFAREAAAQATPPAAAPVPPSPMPADNSGILMALALMGMLLLLTGIGVKIWDTKRKREAEAVHLQSQISDALLREGDFFGLAITPTVHAGLRKDAPVRIEMTGQASSAAVHDAALRIVRDEASRSGRDFEIDDRIEITPAAMRRVA